ncbi:polysaccharide biosynthesis tyrosine autokinase [Aquihabitans sp. G128]|uniref:polysaccharide biosynthesis tyrosine autokinase n=1 Tax=Aquihabitans sp. G128 TaxID=2849779 RepID=UPI001C21DE9E|nr:polysaccharide biosynthesis tyrosine autokinase [Aquihabitans sp. G128]QXC62958.1 polysaccharide biosynthesis tyrosine autokinase [Aquihabitans sp. G128]
MMTTAPEISLARPATQEPALREYFGVLNRRRRAVAIFVALVTLMAVGSSLLQAKRYTAEARVLIQPRDSSEELNTGAAPIVVDRKRIIDTEVRVMSSERVRQRVEKIFGDGTPPVTVTPVEGTDLVSVAVTSTDPALAQAVANATAKEYASYRRDTRKDDLTGGIQSLQTEMTSLTNQIDDLQAKLKTATGARAATLKVQQDSALARYAQLEQQSDSLALSASLSTGDANLVDPADKPSEPTSPQPLRALILGLVAGTVLGIGLAFLLDLLDDRVESKEDVERVVLGRPVLAMVPLDERWSTGGVADLGALDQGGAMAEAFRSLRTSLQFLASERRLKTIQVTSALPGEGKSTTALNLAIMSARAGATTILVDADLRQPRVHGLLDMPNGTGLSTSLLEEAARGRRLAGVPAVPGLYVLTSGPTTAFPAELLQSERAKALIRRLAEKADLVVFDSPPVLPVADPLVLAGQVDAVLLVASIGGTTRRQLGRAVELLDQVGANVCGTVINKVSHDSAAYGQYYGADERSRAARFFRPASV